MIQGINFFDISGLIIFSTKNLINYPDLVFSIICFSIIVIIGFILGLLNKYWCVDKIEESDEEDDLEIQLL